MDIFYNLIQQHKEEKKFHKTSFVLCIKLKKKCQLPELIVNWEKFRKKWIEKWEEKLKVKCFIFCEKKPDYILLISSYAVFFPNGVQCTKIIIKYS